MRTIAFVLSLLLVPVASVWLIGQMVFNTDPSSVVNVAVVLLLLFLASGSVVALISWAILRRGWKGDRYLMALRHGAWAGLFVVTLPLLRWLDALSPFVVVAVFLIVVGMESVILLQTDARAGR